MTLQHWTRFIQPVPTKNSFSPLYRSPSGWPLPRPQGPPNLPRPTKTDWQIEDYLLDIVSENVPRAKESIDHPLFVPDQLPPDIPTNPPQFGVQLEQNERVSRSLQRSQEMRREARQTGRGPPGPIYVPPQPSLQNQAHLQQLQVILPALVWDFNFVIYDSFL